MDLGALVETQAPIDRAIASEIVAVTPESWRTAVMSVRRTVDAQTESFRIEISSPDGQRELVSPTPELFEHIKSLSDLFGRHGRSWIAVTYSLKQESSGDWAYQADFAYPPEDQASA